METLRIGLIGVGNIARLHALGYANTPNEEIYAVYVSHHFVSLDTIAVSYCKI